MRHVHLVLDGHDAMEIPDERMSGAIVFLGRIQLVQLEHLLDVFLRIIDILKLDEVVNTSGKVREHGAFHL